MATCPNCSSTDVVDFVLTPKGEPLRFIHCRHCEHRWWEAVAEGVEIRLPDALDRLS